MRDLVRQHDQAPRQDHRPVQQPAHQGACGSLTFIGIPTLKAPKAQRSACGCSLRPAPAACMATSTDTHATPCLILEQQPCGGVAMQFLKCPGQC